MGPPHAETRVRAGGCPGVRAGALVFPARTRAAPREQKSLEDDQSHPLVRHKGQLQGTRLVFSKSDSIPCGLLSVRMYTCAHVCTHTRSELQPGLYIKLFHFESAAQVEKCSSTTKEAGRSSPHPEVTVAFSV